jgi:hypothetical protein
MVDNSPDYLVKRKVDFEKELTDRINKGGELLGRQVTSNSELGQLASEYSFWHDFNKELLKRAFNKTTNQYFNDYTSSPAFMISSIGGYERPPTLQESISKEKGNISKYLTRLQKIKEKLVLIDELPGLTIAEPETDTLVEGIKYLESLFSRFHKVAQSLRHRHKDRETLIIKDEYDVQDLLRGLLTIQFDDIREEDYSPSYAGGNSRVDFVLKNERIVIETKMTNDGLRDKDIGGQLLIDIGRYRSHPDCKLLIVFIYDKGDHIRNKSGLINDLQNMKSPDLDIKVFIDPK